MSDWRRLVPRGQLSASSRTFSRLGRRQGQHVRGTNCGSVPNLGTGSAIYYNPTAGSAFAVQGCIYQAFLGAGGANGSLGLPVSSEFTNDSAGDRQSDFEGGYIIWTRATGNTAVYHN
jgi:uncharacterized protein with LGFP repeats